MRIQGHVRRCSARRLAYHRAQAGRFAGYIVITLFLVPVHSRPALEINFRRVHHFILSQRATLFVLQQLGQVALTNPRKWNRREAAVDTISKNERQLERDR